MIFSHAKQLNQNAFIDLLIEETKWKEKAGSVLEIDTERVSQESHSVSERKDRF